MIELALPWLLVALPLPWLIYKLPSKKQHQAVPLTMPTVVQGVSYQDQISNKRKSTPWILSLVWVLTLIAASQPQWLGEPVPIPTQGREMMIAVDLSGSMQVEDMRLNGSSVNRLTMVKEILGDFIERRSGDRLGLILFADDAYMQTPMTFDRNTVQQMLDESQLGLVGQQTAIGDAIALAVKRFIEKEQTNKVLLLLTDGQNTAGKIPPEQALELAVAKGVTIYPIGIGADSMEQQTLFGTRRINPSADLDEQLLTELATQTNGQYFRARSSQELSTIYQLIDQLEPVDQEQQQMRPLTSLFYWPLALALMISIGFFIWLTSPWARIFDQKGEH